MRDAVLVLACFAFAMAGPLFSGAAGIGESAKGPVPAAAYGCAVENGEAVLPANFSGGQGMGCTIKHSQPGHGTVKLNGKAFIYKPSLDFSGWDSFTWSVEYARGAASTASAPATCWVVIKKPSMTDWPQWRTDEMRTGFTAMSLPAALHLQWRRDLPVTKGPFSARTNLAGAALYRDIDYCRPVQMGKTLFVPVTASDCLAAFNTDTGELRWRFYASGAVRRPPAAVALAGGSRAVIFASDDGWVYCLNAGDGSVRWKFRAAPNSRMAMGFGRLSSAWPVWASPVVTDGKVYCVAGLIPSFGLYAYCLDAETGAEVWRNDGRIYDIFNTSAFGPLAMSYDHGSLYGSVEGSSRPWVLDAATGEFRGHLGVGFRFPAMGHEAQRSGQHGWYTSGSGAFNAPEPMSITAGSQTFDAKTAARLGVTGTVASLLAGDGKLFVTTAEGGLYCFGGAQTKPVIHALETTPLPNVPDGWTTVARAMLSRNDLKQGLALVLGLRRGPGCGRLVEELARQSSLTIVAVDPDPVRLQALRARMDASGLSGARVSTLEGTPLDFDFAPHQAALIASEDLGSAGYPAKASSDATGTELVEKLYTFTRPFGGEVWLPTTNAQDAALARWVAASKKMPLSSVARRTGFETVAEGFTQIKRTGLSEDPHWLRPPFGLSAFGILTSTRTPPKEMSTFAKTFMMPKAMGLDHASARGGVVDGRDIYAWLPADEAGPGSEPPAPEHHNAPVPGRDRPKWVSSAMAALEMVNPLSGAREKFAVLPASGYDACCAGSVRYGNCWLSGGKISSIGEISTGNYWGRLFFPEIGGCSGNVTARNRVVLFTPNEAPGGYCGCVPSMQFIQFAIAPMEDEENWLACTGARTSEAVEDKPVKRIGVNFGAMGDRLLQEDGVLWTHHPYAGRYGRCSHTPAATPEALPLIPVSYRGPAAAVYRHSAQMEKTGPGRRPWVAASYVKGMSGLTVPLAQPAVALRAGAAPRVDGRMDDACWDGNKRLVLVANKPVMDPARWMGLPRIDEACHATLRYDDENLYVAAGARAGFGPGGRKYLTVILKNRDKDAPPAVLTCSEPGPKSSVIDAKAWTGACLVEGADAFTAEIAIPWKALESAGLKRDRLLVNVDVCMSLLAGQYVTPDYNHDASKMRLTAQYTPLYLDAAQGAVAQARPHTVRLYFAEMEGARAGGRVFDVSLQGQVVAAGLDVVKEAGGPRRELVKEFKGVSIADALVIGFVKHAGEPMLSGAEIVGEY